MSMIAAQLLAEDQVLFLGEDFLPWMVLAFGAALVVGNVLALVRPPTPEGSAGRADGDPVKGAAPKGAGLSSSKGGPAKGGTDGGGAPITRPPMVRTVAMIVVGLVAAAWGLASLLA